mmetsp:Transcript_41543/g.76785  ORF Transcript_41543/g.76785 Transcript_41543/m.76785 type:complete len:135 (+) Transcript_41543:275-679(+)
MLSFELPNVSLGEKFAGFPSSLFLFLFLDVALGSFADVHGPCRVACLRRLLSPYAPSFSLQLCTLPETHVSTSEKERWFPLIVFGGVLDERSAWSVTFQDISEVFVFQVLLGRSSSLQAACSLFLRVTKNVQTA